MAHPPRLLHAAASLTATAPPVAVQLAHTKGAEIEALLRRLSDVNDSMSSALSGSSDSRLHTLGRHRDLLHDFNQVRATCTHHQPSSEPQPAAVYISVSLYGGDLY